MIVVDANVIAYLVLETENTGIAESILAQDADWYAPVLWRSEVQNILMGYIRRNLLTLDKAQEIMNKALKVMEDRGYIVPSDLVLTLATSSNCTAYDCEYVALAHQYNLKLVTFDKEVIKKFPEIASSPQDYLNNQNLIGPTQ